MPHSLQCWFQLQTPKHLGKAPRRAFVAKPGSPLQRLHPVFFIRLQHVIRLGCGGIDLYILIATNAPECSKYPTPFL